MSSVLQVLAVAAVCGANVAWAADDLPTTDITTCGCFSDHTGGESVRYCGDGCNVGACTADNSACPTQPNVDSQLRWGRSVSGNPLDQSGMGFTGEPLKSVPLDREFFVGRLTHFNQPVWGAAKDFKFNMRLHIPAFNVTKDFSFKMDIDETPNNNSTNPCPYPSIEPCSDKISFNNAGFDDSTKFDIGPVSYTLQLTGFKEDQSSTSLPTTHFISNEYLQNEAYLFAKVVAACPDSCEDGGEVQLIEQPDGTFLCGCDCGSKTCSDDLELASSCACVCPFEACQGYESDPLDDCKCTCPVNLGEACQSPRSHWDTTKCSCECPPDQCGADGFLNDANLCTCDCAAVPCPANFDADPLDGCACKCLKTCSGDLILNTTTCTCECDPLKNTCPEGFTWEVNPNDRTQCRCGCENQCGGGCAGEGVEQECQQGVGTQCCLNCKWTPESSCDDGDLCTINDQCTQVVNPVDNSTSYQCQGTPKCPVPIDSCTTFTCNAGTGECQSTEQPDGAACGAAGTQPADWNRCTRECRAGICVDKTPVVCSLTADDIASNVGPVQCIASTCNPSTGLCTVGLAPGKPCNDGNLCTTNDKCDDTGTCAGTLDDCSSVDPVDCYDFVCNPLLGECERKTASAGTPCFGDPDDLCLGNGTCSGGVCLFEDKCERLFGAEALCKKSECVPETGDCVIRNREDGGECVLGNGFAKEDEACAVNFTCIEGVCEHDVPAECIGNIVENPPPETNAGAIVGVIAAIVVIVMIGLALALWAFVQRKALLDPSTWGNGPEVGLDTNPLYEERAGQGDNPLYAG